MKKVKPIRMKISEKTQCGDLFLYKEGEGMCQENIVHLEQKGFGDERNIVSFEIDKIPEIIDALKNLPTLTESNYKTFKENMEKYFMKFNCANVSDNFFDKE